MDNKNIKLTIFASKQNEISKAFDAIVRASKKFGVEEPTMTLSEVYSKEFRVLSNNNDDVESTIGEFYDVIDVEINVAQMFKLNGDYTVFAIINHEDALVRTIDIDDDIPAQYADVHNTHCDHCNQKRDRNKSFILKDSQNNFIKVGKSCMKSFIGLNPESFVSALNVLNEFRTEIEGCSSKPMKLSSRMNTAHTMDLVITLANKLITTEGYVKKLYKEEDERYTSYPVRINSGEATGDKLEVMLFESEIENTVIDTKFASIIRQYIESLPETKDNSYKNENNEKVEYISDIQFNKQLKTLIGRKRVTLKEAMFLCAGINSYYTMLAIEAKKVIDMTSNWVGNIGDKIKLRLTYEGVTSGEGQYGTWYLWSFRDENGNIFKKFGQLNEKFRIEKPLDSEFEKGDVFEFVAEIKEHSTYKEIKSTVLGRLSKAK
jgi:hypothetical protein